MSRNRWPELCKKYELDDGLPVRPVGPWTEDKLFFWNRYVEITTTAMVGHQKWPAGLAYVDFFGGPGICLVETTNKRVPGSALIAANAPKPFQSLLVSELDPGLAMALRTRLSQSPAAPSARVFEGDCNDRVHDIVKQIPPRALTLAFVDPENLRIDFSTVQTLASAGQVDLLVLFADRMDIVRNVDLYERQPNSVLDRMLGPHSEWRKAWQQLQNRTAENISDFFATEYKERLRRRLGYSVFGDKVIRTQRGPLYRLIFASKNRKGLEFWNKVTKKDRGGQTEMF